MSSKYICVYCGSSMGNDPACQTIAKQTGSALADAGFGLVYGGAAIGLMGLVADSVLAAGGSVIGVIPEIFADRIAHPRLTQTHVVKTMHDRKKLMFDLSDGFIALPGGFGTLEELAENITWSQIGMSHKPVGIINWEGYYDPLLALVDTMIDKGFTRPGYRDAILVDSCPRSLLGRFMARF